MHSTYRNDRSDYSSTITVLIGEAEAPFTVHENLIYERSEFFKAAVTRGWQETQSKTVRITHQEPALFQIYLETIYATHVSLLAIIQNHAHEIVSEETAESLLIDEDRDTTKQKVGHSFIMLYMLGDYLSDVKLQKMVVQNVVKALNENNITFLYESIKTLFENMPSNCSLQKLVADVMAVQLNTRGPDHVDELAHEISAQITTPLLKAKVADRYNGGNPNHIGYNAAFYI